MVDYSCVLEQIFDKRIPRDDTTVVTDLGYATFAQFGSLLIPGECHSLDLMENVPETPVWLSSALREAPNPEG
jgi:hypothetical protein